MSVVNFILVSFLGDIFPGVDDETTCCEIKDESQDGKQEILWEENICDMNARPYLHNLNQNALTLNGELSSVRMLAI